MFARILKKDIKRKKTMNCILLLFVILASMFVASGINNVVTVINGTDYYLDAAGIGDYIVITMGDNVIGALDDVLESEPEITDYRLENVMFGSNETVCNEDGEVIKTKNAAIFQTLDGAAISFFDKDNNELKNVEEGHVYASGNFLSGNDLSPGDKIRVRHNDVDMTLTIDGKAKDALLGSDFMGNTRFILNEADMNKLLADDYLKEHYQGQICYITSPDTGAVASALSSVNGIAFDGSRATIKMCYVMDMIVAFIMLIMSICLMLVSFVVLKFSISFTISEEFREIGVMKAIGIGNMKIRSLYIIKYLMIALIGAAAGFIVSIPFGDMLLASVSDNMVLGNNIGYYANMLGSVLVIIVIILFAYRCTGRVKRYSPVDAVRSGQTGERFGKKSVYRIGRSHTGTNLYLAMNDFVSSPRRFLTVIIPFFICTLFVLVMVNTTATMNSPNLIGTFVTKSDLYMDDSSATMKYMNGGTKEEMSEYLEGIAKKLAANGMPATLCKNIQYKYMVSVNDRSYKVTCEQGLNTSTKDYEYIEGDVPDRREEIAITPQISEKIGAKIGDKVIIEFGSEKLVCIVTAYFQSMNQLGEVIRLHEDAPTDFEHIASAFSTQITFTDNPSESEIEERKAKVMELYDTEDVLNTTEYCVDCLQVVDTMAGVKYMLLGITFIVVWLVTILVERSFIADEKTQIAILKAIGFRDRDVILWHVYRFGLVSLISVVLAACMSIPVTYLCISPVFGMMGARNINYNIDPVQIFLLYPGIIFIVTVIVAFITSLYTKSIRSRDTADIE